LIQDLAMIMPDGPVAGHEARSSTSVPDPEVVEVYLGQ
jgi:hypothetical protein